jgi:hypothetical protein
MNEIPNYEKLYNDLLLEFTKFKNNHDNKVSELENKVTELTEHLKKYTAHKRNKNYYEKNKEIILEKNKEYVKEYKKNLSPEKIQEYNKRAYEKRKNKKILKKSEINI